MYYQKILNLLDNTQHQSSKFRVNNWVEISDYSHGTYTTDNQIEFKILMLMSSLCDYGNSYIIENGNITISSTETAEAQNIRKNIIVLHLLIAWLK